MFGKSLSMVADEMKKLISENERLKADAAIGAAIRALPDHARLQVESILKQYGGGE